ncbi:MAG: hypothetical protein ACYSW4_05000 [Planctomycetota bacterium]|jgi:hypothetical protein
MSKPLSLMLLLLTVLARTVTIRFDDPPNERPVSFFRLPPETSHGPFHLPQNTADRPPQENAEFEEGRETGLMILIVGLQFDYNYFGWLGQEIVEVIEKSPVLLRRAKREVPNSLRKAGFR